MKFRHWIGSLLTICSLSFFATGCGGPSGPAKAPPDDHGHDHSGHDHGKGAAAHPTEGPHHGHLIELGNEEFHLELVDDHKTHTITVYVLDKAAKVFVPTDAKELKVNVVVDGKPTQFSLPAAPQKDDPAGTSSCFQLSDEKLCDALDAKDTKGRINVSINGKPYTANLDHHAHGDHKH